MSFTVFTGQAITTRTKASTLINTVNWKCIIYPQGAECNIGQQLEIHEKICMYAFTLHAIDGWAAAIGSLHTGAYICSNSWYSNPLLPGKKRSKFWIIKAKSFCESTHARGRSGSLFQALHDYEKSQAINIYVQSYWGNKKNIFPCRTVCKNNL